MHSSSIDTEVSYYSKDVDEVFVAVATLVTEGRIPSQLENSKSKKFYEGPHCTLVKEFTKDHKCDLTNPLCQKYENDREAIIDLYEKGIPLCVEVLFTCLCKEINNTESDTLENAFLLEQWHFSISTKKGTVVPFFSLNQLVSAIRSQLYFSQITVWLSTQHKTVCPITENNFRYRLIAPGQSLASSKFLLTATKHEFPVADIGCGSTLNVSFFSAQRTAVVPSFGCTNCWSIPVAVKTSVKEKMELKNGLFDDRMHMSCTLKGKHHCEVDEEFEVHKMRNQFGSNKRIYQSASSSNGCEASTSNYVSKSKLNKNIEKPVISLSIVCEKRNNTSRNEKQSKSSKLDFTGKLWHQNSEHCHGRSNNDLSMALDKGQLLLDAIERSGKQSTKDSKKIEKKVFDCQRVQKCGSAKLSECDNTNCDKSESDIFSIKHKNNFNLHVDKHCDSPIPTRQKKISDISNLNIEKLKSYKVSRAKQRLTFDNSEASEADKSEENWSTDCINSVIEIPTPKEQEKFRKHLDSAASMVFHARTGLPLTSSPAPVRKGKTRFDFDASLNSVSAIKRALFSNGFSTDEESESESCVVSPCSPDIFVDDTRDLSPIKYHRKGHSANLLGSFEESVLNGRLEPVSTVHGFKAELGASGLFVPKHLFVPVTVFFYTLGDNDKVSSPYLGHINLGKKGYNVPKNGTVQVTLFNPLGTVVKMFVIMYDLSDMPPNSQTFIRQRTLYMPTNCQDANLEWGPKWLRYLIHLRFMSSKSGKVYLHSDIRMIIFRKCDMDTATAHGIDMSYELRSFTHMPTNPRFSPRK